MSSPQVNIEKLEVLNGDRRGNLGMAAVRRNDLSSATMPAMKSAQIDAAPSMDDFNALQSDIAALYDKLNQLGAFGNSR